MNPNGKPMPKYLAQAYNPAKTAKTANISKNLIIGEL